MLPFIFTPEACFLTQHYYISADAIITLPDEHIALSLLKSCQKVKKITRKITVCIYRVVLCHWPPLISN